MSIVATRVTVDDTSGGTAIHTGDTGVSGTRLVVTNRHATNTCSLGPSGLTLAGGYELKAGETVSLMLPRGDELFAIADAAADAILHVLKTGA